MSALSTRVLFCDSSAIYFPTASDEPTITNADTLHSLQLAATQLRAKQPVAFPTETVYGLVLMKHFWPCDPNVVPPILTANHPTVAIRMPSHPVARALIAITGAPLAAPSANSSGKPSPTRAEHVLRDLNGKIGIILDGGACDVGLESTVVDGLHPDGNLRNHPRPSRESCWRPPKVLVHSANDPGMKYRHYSPAVPVTLLLTVTQPPAGAEALDAASFLSSLRPKNTSHPLKIGVLSPTDSPLGQFDLNVEGIEAAGVDLILIEEIDDAKEGLAVMNRVRKAASHHRYIRC
ncbi:hypothetical protein BDZ89DRAFT_1094688 [Hymenopellis radicata]|nr:hypothetical protein BDZ89DRAFT_1094688 [Hymenopellis radicata]